MKLKNVFTEKRLKSIASFYITLMPSGEFWPFSVQSGKSGLNKLVFTALNQVHKNLCIVKLILFFLIQKIQ